jgi:hypothetical protein
MTTREMSPRSAESLAAHLAGATADESSLRRFLTGLPGVDPARLRAFLEIKTVWHPMGALSPSSDG